MSKSNPHRIAALVSIVAAGVVAGCGTSTQQLMTPHYTLNHPDFWKVKKTATKDGEATVVVIPQYGTAVIDEGTGAMANKDANYDAYTADVEVRLYSWVDPQSPANPTDEVGKRLLPEPDLALPRHHVISDNPPECGVYPKKYTIFGVQQTPIDLVSRPGYRTVVVGGKTGDVLLGAVARVEYEPDPARFCHNLSNMRVQLQNLLDGVQPAPGGGAARPPPSSTASTTSAVPQPGSSPPP
jgi:hypothetical protein